MISEVFARAKSRGFRQHVFKMRFTVGNSDTLPRCWENRSDIPRRAYTMCNLQQRLKKYLIPATFHFPLRFRFL